MKTTLRIHSLLCSLFGRLAAGLLLFCPVWLGSCRKEQAPRWHIGVAQPCDDEWRHKLNREIQREAMFHPNVEITFSNGENDSRLQNAQIREFMKKGIDLLIVAPNEARQVTPVIEEAMAAGIPVVTFDRNVYGSNYTAHFEPDNEGIGAQAAVYARHLIPFGPINALEIRGLDHSTPAQQRHAGFSAKADSLPGFNIMSVGGDWNADRAAFLADSMLRKHPDINLIYAHNDHMAIAAAEALRKLGRDDIRILGTDAVPEVGLKAVTDNIIDATFIYPTEGHRLLRTALDILEGRPYNKEEVSGTLSSVDRTNADILLRQYGLLNDETEKVEFLLDAHRKLDFANRVQTRYIYLLAGGVLLLLCSLALLLMTLRQRKRFQRNLAEKNAQLEQEKEKQAELYRQLDDATKSKLMFYTNVSHDLRTPLSLIAAPVEKVAAAPYLSPEDSRLLGIAVRNIGMLRRLINQLLDFRKYENGKLQLRRREMDFEAYAVEWMKYFSALATSRDITLETEMENPQRVTFSADPDQLQRVVFNLITNAFRFTPDNGRIRFRAVITPETLYFSVEDNGAGISEEDIGHVFDRFYQSANKRKYGGSGLGLSVSKAIVELHGGKIEVKSRPGGPTFFEVTIPVTHEASPEMKSGNAEKDTESREAENDLSIAEEAGEYKEADSLPTLSADRKREDDSKPLLLVIDDNKEVLDMMKALLEDEFQVICSDNGLQGIAVATRYEPDAVICDLRMPGTDGLEVCRVLKSETATSHIPVLMLTASPVEEQRMQSYNSGADAFLGKPFEEAVLRSRLRNLLASRERLSNEPSLPPTERPQAEARKKSSTPLELENDFYREFLEVVKGELKNPDITIEQVAARMGLSQAQLTRKVKALTNYTPVEIIRKLRLQEARRLLISTEMSISEITYAVGFSSPAYFSKCFRDTYRISPREFRNSIGKGEGGKQE